MGQAFSLQPGFSPASDLRSATISSGLDRVVGPPPFGSLKIMSTLLAKALEQVGALPQDEQDAIASQILASLADEDAWKKRIREKRDVIRRMATEALEEDERGETLPLGDLL